jgi:hypothetical protein
VNGIEDKSRHAKNSGERNNSHTKDEIEKTNIARRARAYDRALIASRVLDPKVFPLILTAVEEKDITSFFEACKKKGIDEAMANDMWRATEASRRAQSLKPCW